MCLFICFHLLTIIDHGNDMIMKHVVLKWIIDVYLFIYVVCFIYLVADISTVSSIWGLPLWHI